MRLNPSESILILRYVYKHASPDLRQTMGDNQATWTQRLREAVETTEFAKRRAALLTRARALLAELGDDQPGERMMVEELIYAAERRDNMSAYEQELAEYEAKFRAQQVPGPTYTDMRRQRLARLKWLVEQARLRGDDPNLVVRGEHLTPAERREMFAVLLIRRDGKSMPSPAIVLDVQGLDGAYLVGKGP